ncbi:MAG: threonine--tRNA ligase [Chloroflexi bacterium]|nr:threonine--tRNA ligase [Chloroflexota bacterium]|tara:strand:- start:873 stop:2642 length:1770 start_codon:yes stop_codon:yes gene_type:complete
MNSESNDLIDIKLDELHHRIRHSAAHIMADAVLEIYPEAKIAIGPATQDGFYYDFDLNHTFSPEDLDKIEKIMLQRIKENLPFERKELTRDQALKMFKDQPYKIEIIENLSKDESISIYEHGNFVDLCEGPHVATTKEVKALKLLSIAGAYWRGDENNSMLQRIYGTAFENKEALDAHLLKIEEAALRDHRKLGRELELFIFDPISPASPFFLPKGTIIYNELIDYVKNLYSTFGYQEVITPLIFSTDLWKQSGHYDNYQENMYFIEVDEREFGVKPMNCPAHALMYASKLHSYRDLPLRYADFGRLHRYERSGVTHGLTRVRTFSQDDAHIFCTEDQIEQEATNFITMIQKSYEIFEFKPPRVALSLRPEKSVGDKSLWDKAEKILKTVLENNKLSYDAMAGEGAFYGPKIDFFVPDAIGREWQLGTLQLDFSLPERFNLEYINQEGNVQRPAMLHRAMFGSIERFMGVILEHYGGALPLWLSPIQATIIPIADRHIDYAEEINQQLIYANFRTNIDSRSERMNSKIRDAQLQKIPYMLIVGDKEQEEKTVAIRKRQDRSQENMNIDMLIKHLTDNLYTKILGTQQEN